MIPDTMSRVAAHTPDDVNAEIRRRIERGVRRHAERLRATGRTDAIDRRLDQLDDEWDIERMLEANAASISLLGLGLAAFVDRRWLLLPAGVAAFLLQHAVQGWCPPVPAFRRLGVRTAAEIDEERYALKALRGDFDDLPPDEEAGARATEAMRAVRV